MSEEKRFFLFMLALAIMMLGDAVYWTASGVGLPLMLIGLGVMIYASAKSPPPCY